ncbi:MAG: 5'-3' exonuclease [Actinobacteria bacterium RBG_16_70_17]|nr:MAG: 5'-3' exonuclease [Actinobacteria bacterium RBG_16_70_17]
MRVHLLDGTYELFRAYYGAPKRTSPDGAEVGAVQGLMASTLSLLQGEGVTHLGAAFDTVIRSFRNDLFPGYKTEAGVPADLLAQFPLAEEGLEALGVVVWRMTTYEADDALATAAARFADETEQVVLMTPDKDLCQCVQGTRVVCYDRRKGAFFDEEGVWGRFGVAPESIPDYLALVGDSADGLPGVRGWGAKSSAAALARYRHLEGIPLEARLWETEVRGAERLVEALRGSLGEALVYRFLATLRRDVPLRENLADLEWQGVRRRRFLEFCERWGLEGLRDRPRRWAAG